MASDPTDLIREATEAVDDQVAYDVFDLVRRLRDALVTMGACPHYSCSSDGTGRWRCDQCGGDQGSQNVGEVRAALAEANTTIQRIEALTYRSDDGTEWTHLHPDDEGEPECAACWAQSIRRALKGEP